MKSNHIAVKAFMHADFMPAIRSSRLQAVTPPSPLPTEV